MNGTRFAADPTAHRPEDIMTKPISRTQASELSDADLEKVTGGDGKTKSTGHPTVSDITVTKVFDVASPSLYR